MKKLFAMLLALLLVLLNVAALAESPSLPDFKVIENAEPADEAAASPSITKTYTTTGTNTSIYPTETLEFTVTPAVESYPEVTVGTNNTFDVAGGTTGTYSIPVNVPEISEYGVVGRYHYTVMETGASTPSQAVDYDTTTVFNVDVYITYKLDDDGKVTDELEQYIVIYSGDDSEGAAATSDQKEDDFSNEYSVGSLKVTKEISGNLADPNKEFPITITLTSEKNVANDITITGDATFDATDLTEKGWKTRTITFTAKGGEYILIENIPAGVTYTVVEDDDINHIAADEQMENVNDADAYYVTGEVSEAADIAADENEVTITNTKEITVPTGITVDYLPYVLILAVAFIGIVMMVSRKREEH